MAWSNTSVLIEARGKILVVTLNRPSVRNAIDYEMATGIAKAVDLLDGDDGLSVGVLNGAGGHFCAGMDLKKFAEGNRPYVDGRGFAGLVESPPRKPFIAAVEGYALAGGFEIALSCDMIVASTEAVFGLPEVTRGLTPAGGGLLRLSEKVPSNIASELVHTGRRLSSTEAHRYGLANALAPAGGALVAACEMAKLIAANAPLALSAAKAVMMQSRDWTADERFARQEAIVAPVRLSSDAQEGARAFLEKRAPKWTSA